MFQKALETFVESVLSEQSDRFERLVNSARSSRTSEMKTKLEDWQIADLNVQV